MKIMYCRVSSKEQNLDLQLKAGKKEGVEKYFEEKISGKNTDRPEFKRMLEQLRSGDVVIVYKLDRLARSSLDLLETIKFFDSREVGFKSLSEAWADTTTPQGRLMITIAAGLAQFERELIAERQAAGIDARREKGLPMGRPAALTPDQKDLVPVLHKGGKSLRQIAEMMGASKRTIARTLKEKGTEA